MLVLVKFNSHFTWSSNQILWISSKPAHCTEYMNIKKCRQNLNLQILLNISHNGAHLTRYKDTNFVWMQIVNSFETVLVLVTRWVNVHSNFTQSRQDLIYLNSISSLAGTQFSLHRNVIPEIFVSLKLNQKVTRYIKS